MLSRDSHTYDLLGEIGRGGMASVTVARFEGGPGVFIPVVIKRILPELEATDDSHATFLEEARTLSLIQHPNVVRVLETGNDMDGQPYIVFEYLHGEPLDQLLKAIRAQGKLLPLEITLHIIAEVLAGLHAAHEARSVTGAQTNLVHRDVSPQNIVVGFDGWVRVIDFGIARTDDRSMHTKEGILKGKIRYMSPEQCRQRPLTRASDIFSVGVVMFELLTNTHPFDASSDFEVMQKICGDVARDPSEVCPAVPEKIAEICLTALEPDPEARFKTALEMRRAIMEAAATLANDYASQPTEVLAEYTRQALPEQYEDKEQLLASLRSGGSVSVGRAVAPENRTMTVKAKATHSRGRSLALIIALLVLSAVAVGVAAQRNLFAKGSDESAEKPVAQTDIATTPARSVPLTESVLDANHRDAAAADPRILLTVESEPSAAKVYLEDRLLGTTPLRERVRQNASRQTIRLEIEGYNPISQQISLGQNVALHINLRRAIQTRAKSRRKPRRRKPSGAKNSPVWPVFQ